MLKYVCLGNILVETTNSILFLYANHTVLLKKVSYENHVIQAVQTLEIIIILGWCQISLKTTLNSYMMNILCINKFFSKRTHTPKTKRHCSWRFFDWHELLLNLFSLYNNSHLNYLSLLRKKQKNLFIFN